MKVIKTSNYIKLAQTKFYLVVTPDDKGGWEVLHSIWPSTQHGGGQVIKDGFPSKEEAYRWASDFSKGEEVVIDEVSGQQRYDSFVNKNTNPNIVR